MVAAPPPPPVPAVVIVARNPEPEYISPPSATWFARRAVQAEELGARLVVAEESGHFVSLDQPEVVVTAIEDVVAAARDPSRWATPASATPRRNHARIP